VLQFAISRHVELREYGVSFQWEKELQKLENKFVKNLLSWKLPRGRILSTLSFSSPPTLIQFKYYIV